MLESMRQRGASIFIYLIFGILIAVFVINFGPQGPGGEGGCGTSSNTVVDVDGSEANLSAYRVAYSNNFNRLRQRGRVYFAIETLIRREILADAAAERGLRVTGDMVDEEIKKGYFFLGGLRIPLGQILFDEHEDGTRTWNVRKFKNWVAGLDVKSTSTYRDEQTRSLQAAMMYELLSSGVRVSREEALADFLFSKNTVAYDVVTFDPAPYRAAMRLSDADIERFLASHEAEVKARYQQDERLYKGLKPQLKLRQIFIAKAEQPKPSGTDAGSAAPAPTAAKTGMSIDEAKAKLEAARTAITGGKQKFADVAKQLSTDEAAKTTGGDLGWRGVENPQLGDKALNDAAKALKPGDVSPVITTDAGAYLLTAEDTRSGDLAYDKVKHEIAAELARDTWAKEAAKRAALAALADAQAGTGKNLADMFPKAPDAGGGMNLDFLGDPNLSEEQKRMLMEQLKKQMEQQMPKSGSITIESKDVPVKWGLHQPDETKGNSGSNAGSGTAAPKPAAGSGSAAPATPGAGAGTATPGGTGAGTGSATGSAASPPTTTPPTPGVKTNIPPVEATQDQLPAFATVDKPNLVSYPAQPRQEVLPGLGKDLTPIVFDELSAGMLAKRVYEVDGAYVLLQVTNKAQAKVEDFDKEADRYIQRLQTIRSFSAAEDFIQQRCNALKKDDKIVPMRDLVAETDDQGNPTPRVYQPCMYQGLTGTKQFEWLELMLPALGYGEPGGG